MSNDQQKEKEFVYVEPEVDIGSEYLDQIEEKYAEDDPLLKQSLDEEETTEGETPNTYPSNDTRLNVEILNIQESEERQEEEDNWGAPSEEPQHLPDPTTKSADQNNKAEEKKLIRREPIPTQSHGPQYTTAAAWILSDDSDDSVPNCPTLSAAAWGLTITVVSGIVGFMVPPVFIITFFAGMYWVSQIRDPQYAIERAARTGYWIRNKKLAAGQRIAVRKAAYAQRQVIRRLIENMPQYQEWRQQVLARDRKMCRIVDCGSTENLEVDHRESFDSIIKRYNLTNEIEARICLALWDVNNGLTLCKPHHDQTATSRYRASRV